MEIPTTANSMKTNTGEQAQVEFASVVVTTQWVSTVKPVCRVTIPIPTNPPSVCPVVVIPWELLKAEKIDVLLMVSASAKPVSVANVVISAFRIIILSPPAVASECNY